MLETSQAGPAPATQGPGQINGAIASFNRDQVFKLAKEDLNFLAALCLPDVFEHYFPEIHLAVWNLLRTKADLTNDFTKLALGLPRGHAKTTLIKLFVIYLILFTDRQFILIVCASAPLAENFLADVKSILSSPNIVNTFGDWEHAIETDQVNLKKFSFQGRNIILAASGMGSIRGLNIHNRRPDVIVMDDMQSREASESITQCAKDLRWMTGTLMKTKDPSRCLYIYIGNMYPGEGCILNKLKKNKNWVSFIVGAILADGQPIWPELHSIESLMAEFENDVSLGQPEVFFSEVMNDPDSGVSSIININLIPPNPYEKNPLCTGKFIIIDVATDKIGADDTTIILYGMYGPDVVMEKIHAGSYNPKDTIIEALKLALSNGATVIAVEAVAYQSSLLFWFDEVAKQIGLTGISFVPLSPRGVHKNTRIMSWLKRLLPSKDSNLKDLPPREYLSNEVRSKVIWQITQWKKDKRDNVDDIIDNGAYAEQTVELYGAFISIPALETDPEINSAKVLEENYPF